MNGSGVAGFFLKHLSSLSEEKIVQSIPRGQKVLFLLAELEKTELAYIAFTLLSKVHLCIAVGKSYKLPSASQASVRKSFHQMRNSASVKTLLTDLIHQNNCPSRTFNCTYAHTYMYIPAHAHTHIEIYVYRREMS